MGKSIGQRLIGINFSASSSSMIDEAQQKSAELIDLIQDSLQTATSEDSIMIHHDAIKRLIDAQMWAVKALTWKD